MKMQNGIRIMLPAAIVLALLGRKVRQNKDLLATLTACSIMLGLLCFSVPEPSYVLAGKLYAGACVSAGLLYRYARKRLNLNKLSVFFLCAGFAIFHLYFAAKQRQVAELLEVWKYSRKAWLAFQQVVIV
ncbi:hypothetical protein [Paenibacillus elgii]|uniref:hypothetical protein n=1 Tax=Paenibacillus elgii TaxID=189691 RepID=UPI0020416416|nr:hypothetical protein [Paenibacillus elgii]MCM3267630.1 hypothetical protein [Paenibacillus elgii]